MKNLRSWLAVLVIAASLAGAAGVVSAQEQKPDPGAAMKADSKPPVDFLIESAATDFHKHRPPDPAQFRNVRVGHLTGSNNATRFILCGEFLPKGAGDKAEWVSFVTIKTDPYEQWIGNTATWCQNSSVVWDTKEDLASALKRRYEAK